MAIVPSRHRAQRLYPLLAGLLCLLGAAGAQAAPADLFAPETLTAVGDFRLVASDGERGWTDEGFGKTRFGGTEDHDWKARPVAAEVALVWQPRLSWAVTGTVVAAYQDDQDHPVDLIESFVTLKPLPKGPMRVSARIGLFWPPVSLEHQGASWSVTDMITPSAINSWIGEEVKVIGAEATVTRDIGASQLSGSLAVFGFNDTAGTLLAFRGWALHDLKAGAFGHQPLPPLNEDLEYAQAEKTRPLIEIDDRPGFYGKLSWRLPIPLTVSAFYYDNRADPEIRSARLQWGWATKFWNLGARIDLSDHTKIFAQALSGKTEMGTELDERYWVETRFRSAYLRVSHQIASVTVSGRYDLFDTHERGYEMEREESEKGWAATGAISWSLSSYVNILGEVLHVRSDRDARVRIGAAPHQQQTTVQAALRLSF
ncbi:MAG: hypothetical protein JWN69_124 [Alphaproteobacteria bacterium]|nr:hypothetical protein [Alphaproteobacteria bacterium]